VRLEEGVREMTSLANEVTGRGRAHAYSQKLEQHAEVVDRFVERVQRARDACIALSARVSPGSRWAPPASGAAACDAIDTWAELLTADIERALDGNSFTVLRQSLSNAISEIEAEAMNLWEQYRRGRVVGVSTDLLEALADDPNAQKMRRLLGRLKDIADVRIVSPEQLDKFDESTDDLRDSWARFDAEGISKEVVTFLRLANSGVGAPLSDATEDVIRWLRDRGALDRYVVRSAG